MKASFEIFALFLQNGSLDKLLQETSKSNINTFFIYTVYHASSEI